jgi:saccharopine dehydrogenase-like NADP-dependent oxidoreductase
MKNILIIGAGMTATALIEYLLKKAEEFDWFINVGDLSLKLAQQKVSGSSRGQGIRLNIESKMQRESAIKNADLVISYLPPALHVTVAKECLKWRTNFITPSYISPVMRTFHEEAKSKDLIFLNEMGLDPGIDHMDAAKMINNIKQQGGEVIKFKSVCGGLISPESDDNPWGYKFTWNPLNLVMAGGHSIARYIEQGRIKIVPYNRLFLNTEIVGVPGVGEYEVYPNRDSLLYLEDYGLKDVKEFYRGTLRKPGFSRAWHALVRLGLTDNSYRIPNSSSMTYREWVSSYLPQLNGRKLEKELEKFLESPAAGEIIEKLKYIDLFSDRQIEVNDGTPAEILLSLLEEKWKMRDWDKDMVILQSEVLYQLNGKRERLKSTMVYIGKEKMHTAMTYTAGLPAAIGARLIMEGKVKDRGVIIPVSKDIYIPALKELEEYGVIFKQELVYEKSKPVAPVVRRLNQSL